jgi:long-chain acyl-CoA synthetase
VSSPVDPNLIRTRPASLAHVFRQRVASSGDAVAYLYPVGEEWRHATWDDTGDLVDALAAGLIAIGVGPEEPVAIMAGTRFEWILSDLAIMCAGAATTTIYPTTVDRDVIHILNDCGARVVIAEDDEQVLKLWRILDHVPRLARVVQRNVVEQRYAEQIAVLYPVVDAPSFELDDLSDAELAEELATR